jgi:hypothetical protein
LGCYLDLIKRTKGKLADSYGDGIVNIYIPSHTYGAIYKKLVAASEFDNFAEGSEILDHRQGLTSFLCQKGDKTSPLTIVIYESKKGLHYSNFRTI